MVQSSPTEPSALPPPHSHSAPYFSGELDEDIDEFLQEYEELTDKCQLTEEEKVKKVIRYVAKTHKDFWRAMDGYKTNDWEDLCEDLRASYLSATVEGRHSLHKLQDFVRDSARTRMNEEQDVISYHRKFLMLSKHLYDAQEITPKERNTLFWRGFHPDDRAAMFSRLIARNPEQPRGQAFSLRDVLKIVRAVFTGNQLPELQVEEQGETTSATAS